jgi:hypothetical protein
MKISELYGKQVLSCDKKKSGYVLGVSCIGNKIAFLLCFDEHEREFYVDVNNITKMGEKIIYEDAAAKLKYAKLLRLGKAGYSESGKFIGHLEDCEVKGFDIKRAYIGNRKIDFARLVCGDIVIIKDRLADKNCAPAQEKELQQKEPRQKEPQPPHELLIDAVLGNGL